MRSPWHLFVNVWSLSTRLLEKSSGDFTFFNFTGKQKISLKCKKPQYFWKLFKKHRQFGTLWFGLKMWELHIRLINLTILSFFLFKFRKITIPDTSPVIFRRLLLYLYGAPVDKTVGAESICELMLLADRFSLDVLKVSF